MSAAAVAGWRDRLNNDPSPLAANARDALNAVARTEPSYYADAGDWPAYELAREQAAVAVGEWRRDA